MADTLPPTRVDDPMHDTNNTAFSTPNPRGDAHQEAEDGAVATRRLHLRESLFFQSRLTS